jgi:hypothetical protein
MVARFFMVQHTKMGKNVPNNHNRGKPNDSKIYQMATKYTKIAILYMYQYLFLQVPPKFTPSRIFSLEICHLANLIRRNEREVNYSCNLFIKSTPGRMRYPRSGQEDAQLRGRVRRDERQVHQGPRVAGGEGEGAQER